MNTHKLKALLYVLFLHMFPWNAHAENPSYWTEADPVSLEKQENQLASFSRSLELDLNALKSILDKAPDENAILLNTSGVKIQLPLPFGEFGKFEVWSTSMMETDLARANPGIKTFIARGLDDPTAVARLDYTPLGFHALIIAEAQTTIIDPVAIGNTHQYISYDLKDARVTDQFHCNVEDIPSPQTLTTTRPMFRSSGTQLRTYRLAVACTGEFGAAFGTVSAALAGITTIINRINLIYESEHTIRFTLVANNASIVYLNSATDPYSEPNTSVMITQNQSNINSVIGSANYDVGHLFAAVAAGGLANLSSVCVNSTKASGVSGWNVPNSIVYVMIVAHELGHQFSANHSFNSSTGDCINRNSTTAYEPGSGSTIMSYAVSNCGSDNLQSLFDLNFNIRSFDEINIYTTTGSGSSCPVTTSTGNSVPVVSVGANFTIPTNTPFELIGSATDANGDVLSYSWEQYDLGPAGAPGSPSGNAPIFRVWPPVFNPSRTFPRLQDLVNNTSTIGEILPSYARTLNFRLAARDGRLNGGGVGNNDTPKQVTVHNTGAAFAVTAPNTAVTWTGGSTQTVTWNVAGTTASPISCANVNIRLSTDGGYTYPITILSSTPNDGTQSITVPNVNTTQARIRVEGAGNIFFDISNVNFTINTTGATLTAISTSTISTLNYCAGASLSVSFTTNANANAGNVYTAQLSNAYGSFASPTNIGSVSATAPTPIFCTLPVLTTKGTFYRIRVVSSNPAVTGIDNRANIGIYPQPSSPGSITGAATVCQNSAGFAYSVAPINNTTTYSWSVPYGFSAFMSSGPMISGDVLLYASSGNIVVNGTNPGCAGPSSTLAVTVNPVPGNTNQISGLNQVCKGTNGVSYSIPAVSGATGYNWIVPAGATIASGTGTNSITVNYSSGASSGFIGVAAVNACGNGRPAYSYITLLDVPTSPSITPVGPLTICSGGNSVLSFTPVVPNTYKWRESGVDIIGQTAATYTVSNAGSYDVHSTKPYSANPSSVVYINANVYNINDNSCDAVGSPIGVSGYTGLVNTSAISVKVNVNHTWVGDVILWLEAPNGARTLLSFRGGNNANNSGQNYVNTIFSDAAAGYIPPLGAPYTGTYKPDGLLFTGCGWSTHNSTFGSIGGGSINPNGNWTLYALDVESGDVGSIQNWSLTLPPSSASSCTSLSSNTVNVSVQSLPFVSSFLPSSGNVGSSVVITGSGFISVSNVSFNGTPASYIVNSTTQITATVPPGATSGLISVTTNCGTVNSLSSYTVTLPTITLNLKMFFQGFYTGSQQMNGALSVSVADSVEVLLYDSLMNLAFSEKTLVSISGNASLTISSITFNRGYYIVLNHRNCLTTWSSTRLVLDEANESYDFTDAASKAWGSNMCNFGDGYFGLHSGDVNKDGVIDFTDYTAMESALLSILNGYYSQDVNGDNLVESADFSLVENNVNLGLSVSSP